MSESPSRAHEKKKTIMDKEKTKEPKERASISIDKKHRGSFLETNGIRAPGRTMTKKSK